MLDTLRRWIQGDQLEKHSSGDEFNREIKERAKRNVFARGPIFSGNCVPKSLPLKDSPITKVL